MSVKFVVLALSLFTSAHAMAMDIRIDLGRFWGTTPGNWNNIGDPNTPQDNLIDFHNGITTGVSISGNGWRNFTGVINSADWPNTDWVTSTATLDGAGLWPNDIGTFHLSGLTIGRYIVEVVSVRSLFDYPNTIDVDGAYANVTYKQTPVTTPWNSYSDGLGSQNWLIWNDLLVTDGNLAITNKAGFAGIINAIRIRSADSAEIPAPLTALLIAIGLAGIRLAKRKHNT